MRRSICAALALGSVFMSAPGALAEPLKVVSDNPAVQAGYNRFLLHSDRIGRDFLVTVNTSAATPFLPGQKFPVIYALDAGYGVAGPQGMLLASTGAMAPAIVVSVGYQAADLRFRNDDLTHHKFTMGLATAGGGGAAFEAFLLEDLKPFVEARYPADPARSVLFGHSLGGLFAANVFADRPDAFAGYVIGSASVWADLPVVERVAQAASKAHGQKIYLSVGELEDRGAPGGGTKMRDGFNGLVAVLKDRPGITLKTQVYAGETHLSYYPRLVTDGFPFVLPPVIAMAAALPQPQPDLQQRYAGAYAAPDGRKLVITTLPGSAIMMAQVNGVGAAPLIPNGMDRFYAPSADVRVTFDGTGATLEGVGGGKMRLAREKAP